MKYIYIFLWKNLFPVWKKDYLFICDLELNNSMESNQWVYGEENIKTHIIFNS